MGKRKIFNIACHSVLILFFTSILNSCKTDSAYEFEKGIRFYLKEKFDKNKLNGNYYFFLLNNCEDCKGGILNLNLFAKNKNFEDLVLVLVGEENNIDQTIKINQIKENYLLLRDKEYDIYSYETGFGKPMLINFQNDELVNHTFIYDYMIDNYLVDHLTKN